MGRLIIPYIYICASDSSDPVGVGFFIDGMVVEAVSTILLISTT